MTAEVGSILGYLKLDRSDWDAELKAAGAKADELASHNPTIKIGTNAPTAIAQLAAVAAAVKRLQDAQAQEAIAEQKLTEVRNKGTASASQLMTAENNVEKAKRAEAAATINLAAVQDQNSQAMARASAQADKLAASTQKAQAPTVNLWGALAALAPAAVPLAGGLLGLSTGLIGIASSGYLAFKGLTADVQAANVTTDAYQNTLGVLQGQLNSNANAGLAFAATTSRMKSDLTQLESTAASGVLSGFSAGLDKVQAQEPSFNSFIAKASAGLGDIASHGVGALVSLLTAMEPLILTAETDIGKMAASFESWASGPGGVRFFQELGNDIPLVISFLGNLATTVEHVVAAAAPIGTVVLSTLNDLLHVLNLIPVPVLAAVAAGFVSWEVARIAGIAVDTAGAAAIKAAAAAQLLSKAQLEAATSAGLYGTAEERAALATTAAAEGGTVASSRLIGVAGALGKVIPLYIGATLAVGALHNATSNLNDSSSQGARIIGESVADFNNLLHGKVTDMFEPSTKNISASNARNFAQDDVNNYYQGMKDAVQRGQADYLVWQAHFAGATKLGADYANQNMTALQLATPNLNTQVDQAGQISQAPAGFDQITAAIQKNIDAETQWQTATGKTITLSGGVKVSMDNWNLALSQANGSVAGAINIIHGHAAALADDQTALVNAQAAQKNVNQFVSDMQTSYGLTTAQVNLFTTAMGISSTTIEQGGSALQGAEAQFSAMWQSIQNGSTALSGWISAIATFNNSNQTAADIGNLLGSAMVALNGDALSYQLTMADSAKANEKFVVDANGTTKTFQTQLQSIINLKTGAIDYHNAGSSVMLQDLNDLQTASMKAAAATYQHEVSIGNTANAEKDAAAVYYNNTHQALISEASQLGITGDQAKKLADTYFAWPKDAKTQLALLGDNQVAASLKGILDDLDIIAGKKPKPTISINDQASGPLAFLQSQLTGLGNTNVTIPVTTTSNPLNLPGIPNVPNTNHPPKKAGGGRITDGTTGTADDVLIFASKGEYMVNAQAYSRNSALVEAINNGVQGFESGGFVGVGVPPKKTSASSGKAAAGKVTAQEQLLITIGTVDASKFLASIPGTAAAIQSAETTLANAVTKAGGGSGLAHVLASENSALAEDAQDRNEVAAQLKTANSALTAVMTQWHTEQAAVQKTITGSFDITAGYSPEQILATLNKTNQQASLFSQQINTVRSLGLDKNLVAQIAQKGLTAEPELLALSRASKSQIGQVNSGVGQLGTLGQTIGNQEANSLYGAGVAAAQGLVNGLKSQQAAITKAMTGIADAMVNQIKKDLKIASPSQVMRELGGFVGQGMALGIVDQHPNVRRAASGMGAAATPSVYGSDGAAAGARVYAPITVNPSPSMDENALGIATSRQLAARIA